MKRMLGVVVACIVGVVLVAGFAAPLLSSIGGNITVTVDNSDAQYTMHEADENKTYTIEWNDGETFVNGVKIKGGMSYPGIVIADNIVVLANDSRIAVYDYQNNIGSEFNSGTFEITFSEGDYSYVKNGTSNTGSYDFAWIIDPEKGEWSVIERNKTFNVNKDTEFYVFTSSFYTASVSAHSPYSIWKYENETGSVFVTPKSTTGTIDDYELQWNNNIVGSNDENYEYNNNAVLSFTINDGTATTNALALVPTQYQTSNTMTETSESIISILPILFILILLIIAAYSIMDYVKKSKLEY